MTLPGQRQTRRGHKREKGIYCFLSLDRADSILSALLIISCLFSIRTCSWLSITIGTPSRTRALMLFPVASLICSSSWYSSMGMSIVTFLDPVMGISRSPVRVIASILITSISLSCILFVFHLLYKYRVNKLLSQRVIYIYQELQSRGMKVWGYKTSGQKHFIFCVCTWSRYRGSWNRKVETVREGLFLRNKVIISNNNYNNNNIIIIVQKVARQLSSKILIFLVVVLQLSSKNLQIGGHHV